MSREYFYRAPHSIVFATTVKNLYKNHKTNFDGVNIGAGTTRHTSLDWFLVPKERPSIEKASVKEHYIDIPGANGGLDLTESLTGFPLYDYIEGEFEFTVLNERKLITVNDKCEKTKETEISWEVLNRDIREFLNGKERYMMLEDDPSWYYVGRFTVGKYDSSETANSKIVISYKVYPYKKLSTWADATSSDSFKRGFFDAQSLTVGDTREVLNSFWNKYEQYLFPGDYIYYNGNTARDLPCGSECVSINFHVVKRTACYIPKATFTTPTKTVVSDINTPVSNLYKTVKIRGIVITNKRNKENINSILYSDNTLKIELPYPATYDNNKPYSEGDVVSYHHVVERPLLPDVDQHITWIMKAKEDITAGSSLNLNKWEVDTTAMRINAYSNEHSYEVGDLAYIYSNTLFGEVFALIQATEHVTTGSEFDPTQWNLVTDTLPKKDIYYPIDVSITYDIGVM